MSFSKDNVNLEFNVDELNNLKEVGLEVQKSAEYLGKMLKKMQVTTMRFCIMLLEVI